MAENNRSSQESLPLSQETFRQLFSLIECPLSNLMDDKISEVQDEAYGNLINNMSRRAQTSFNMPNDCSSNAMQEQFIQDEICLLEEFQGKAESTEFNSIAIPSQYPQRPVSSLPASENYAGDFQFTVSFNDQKATKGVSWIFSHELQKLYVSKGVPCPVKFSTATSMPEEVYIRAMALFSSSDHASEKVTRCVNHSIEEIQRNIFEAEHFVRCESNNACYENDPVTGRHSVIVPYENPPAGQLFSTYLFKFMCFGSCSGGPNRRPLMIIFTLERRGVVLGRQRIDLKVCACPVRDYKADNKTNVLNNKPVKRPNTDQLLINLPKKIKAEDGKKYNLQITDKKEFKFLKQMQLIYKVYSQVKNEAQWKAFLNASSQSSSSEETDIH